MVVCYGSGKRPRMPFLGCVICFSHCAQHSKHGSIASILKFPEESNIERVVSIDGATFKAGNGKIGIIGAGNYTSSTVIPALKKAKASIKYIASAGVFARACTCPR